MAWLSSQVMIRIPLLDAEVPVSWVHFIIAESFEVVAQIPGDVGVGRQARL
jgi:hypothetical protein